MEKVKIIKLTPERWEEYKNLRLEALKNEPTAFAPTYEEKAGRSDEEWQAIAKRQSDSEDEFILCAEVEGRLVGLVGVDKPHHQKMNHVAIIVGFYIKPEYRGKGIGKKLLQTLLDKLESNPAIAKINLDVTTTNNEAVNLYKSLDFEIVGELKREYLIDGQFYDVYEMEKYLNWPKNALVG